MTRKDFMTVFGLVPVGASCLVKAAPGGVLKPPDVPPLASELWKTSDMRKIQDHSLYCRWTLPPGTLVPSFHYFFRDPLRLGRGIEDTNMSMHGYLPQPQEYLAQRIFFLFSPRMEDADRDLFMSRYSYQFEVGDLIKHRGPLVRFPVVAEMAWTMVTVPIPGLGPTVSQVKTARGELAKAANPFYVHLQEPIHIHTRQYFSVRLDGAPFDLLPEEEGGTGLNVICLLDGMGCFGAQ